MTSITLEFRMSGQFSLKVMPRTEHVGSVTAWPV